MVKRLLASSIFLALLLIGLGTSPKAHADVNDFTVTNFTADYYLSNSSPHGAMDVTEKIAVNYSDYNHGILRAIPNTYKNHPLKLKIDSVSSPDAPADLTTSSSNGNTVLRIGNPNQTVTGAHSYTIKYSVKNVMSFYSDHDELFWDINGDQWDQPFASVTARFHIQENLVNQLQDRRLCYAGSFGLATSEDCTINREGSIITARAQNLGAGETLSVVLAFNKGAFAAYIWKDTLIWHIGDVVISVISLLILALAFRRWWLKGKDPKGAGVIVPQYGPPKGVSVLDAGILQDYKLDNKDITAVIIDLAVRGYVTIIEQDKKTLFLKSGTVTTLQLNNADFSGLKDYESQILTTLFDDNLTKGATITIGKYQSGMSSAIREIRITAIDRLVREGMFDSKPGSGGGGWMAIYLLVLIALTVAAFMIHAPWAGAFGILALLIDLVLLVHMPRRSQQGALYNDDLKGLKLYLKTAEADRIKMLQSPNAKYATNAAEPTRTVKLFEKLLPFAIIFGVEKDWAKQFNDLYTQPPDWYRGNWATFNAVALTDHINTTTAAFNTTFSPPSSSSGSGFGGGGGAGGGGGGGGGGGW